MTRKPSHRRHQDLLTAKKSVVQWIEDLLDQVAAYRDREKAFTDAINTLYDETAHGDEHHRAWLKEKIKGHFSHLFRDESK